jgi:acetyl-CoA/propionyl-CoA carboxylase, biotin carboxylase, biotin carboxyl carrier protein
MFDRIMVANRGEIAVRIARTCKELGISYVAVHSDVDARARHVALADQAVHLPGVAPTDTYLDVRALIEAAQSSGAQAVHPGYGFLAESAEFARAVRDAGLVWVGPPAEAIEALGDKISARRIAAEAGVPVVPGLTESISDAATVRAFADEHGYPVAIKAAGGGGGRGLKVVASSDEVDAAFDSARREGESYFGNPEVFVERYLPAPKHMEVQLLAPSPDDALWLGVRDCSLQRRHQKLIEETPPPRWQDRVPDMGAAAVALSKACGYANAGTVEMLVDEDGSFYFLEVNARLQVEHTVTEEVFGIDLVACQLRIASGDSLGFGQDDLDARGHSIECRINAEDPSRGFIPTPGKISTLHLPGGPGVRVDAGYDEGDEVPGAYDSLIAKVITLGSSRDEARARMRRALTELRVEGIATTIPAHLALLEHAEFVEGTHTTRTVEGSGVLDSLAQAESSDEGANVLMFEGTAIRLWSPAMAASASAAVHGAVGGGELTAPMQGTILRVAVSAGDEVETGDTIAVLEAMKMETVIAASHAGVVKDVKVAKGDTVGAGQVLAIVE